MARQQGAGVLDAYLTLEQALAEIPQHRSQHGQQGAQQYARITSYNVCYTKLLRHLLMRFKQGVVSE